MDKELKKQLKNQHKCIHCQRDLPEGYTIESCPSCKRILKKAAAIGGWRWKLTVAIFDHYGWRCQCCGETIPEFLSLDHKFGGGNKDREEKRMGSNDWYTAVVKDGFPEEFQILCLNCNLGRQRNGGVCPHEYER